MSALFEGKTLIRILSEMRAKTEWRQENFEATSAEADWARGSRVWSRQSDGLTMAILAEPPQSIDDVQTILMNLVEFRDLLGSYEDATAKEIRDRDEITDVAVHNCVVGMATLVTPDFEPTDYDLRSIDWSIGLTKGWLPDATARSEWDEALAEYEAAVEDDKGISAADKVRSVSDDAPSQDRISKAEDALMAIPSPDAAAHAIKHLIAHGGGRETDCWDAMLEIEARRFSNWEGSNGR